MALRLFYQTSNLACIVGRVHTGGWDVTVHRYDWFLAVRLRCCIARNQSSTVRYLVHQKGLPTRKRSFLDLELHGIEFGRQDLQGIRALASWRFAKIPKSCTSAAEFDLHGSCAVNMVVLRPISLSNPCQFTTTRAGKFQEG